ncbi:hypothetical protein CYLTODRAFT_419858 [Cylindrobasidium torrendii FP15055 ss-10]|uniref:Uncharacterized protein n=1 Tax=Cylindrobasidium torrendii FP15055 ss-10 TaxID=1314674 RepID=A0A0D7BIK5_9AGAR|nr:hypothetical protein CYLTODRAFT_419858 [Cylindrobasidium torrendii FP15055 ss-10]
MRGEVVVSVTKGKLYMTCKYPNHNEDLFVPRIARSFRRLARDPTSSVPMTVISQSLGGLNLLTAGEISCAHSPVPCPFHRVPNTESCPRSSRKVSFSCVRTFSWYQLRQYVSLIQNSTEPLSTELFRRRGSHGWKRLHLRAHLLGLERLFLADCTATNLEVVAVNEVATGSKNPSFPQSENLASSVEYGSSTLRRIRDFCLKEHDRKMMMANRKVSTEYRVFTNARNELQIMQLQSKRLAEVLPPGRPIRRHGLVLAELYDELQERIIL